jgi:hypothetical protein
MPHHFGGAFQLMALTFTLEAKHHCSGGQDGDDGEQAADKARGAKRQPEAAARWLDPYVCGVWHGDMGPALTLAANG